VEEKRKKEREKRDVICIDSTRTPGQAREERRKENGGGSSAF